MIARYGLLAVELPPTARAFTRNNGSSSSSSSSSSSPGSDGTGEAATGAVGSSPVGVSCASVPKNPLKLRRAPSPTQLEENRALLESDEGPRGAGMGGPRFCLWVSKGLLSNKCIKRLLLFNFLLLALVPFLLLLVWGCRHLHMQRRMHAVFAAEAAAAAAAAAAAQQKSPYSHLLSEALQGLAALPAAPRGISCWGIDRYELPEEQQQQQQQRDAVYDLLDPAVGAAVPSPEDILAAAPWLSDASSPSLTLGDWAAVPPPRLEQQERRDEHRQGEGEEGQHQLSLCTYSDPRYGVVVTSLLASLISSPENGCIDSTCALPFWQGPSSPSANPQQGASSLHDGAPFSTTTSQRPPPHGEEEAPQEGFPGAPVLCVGRGPSLYNGCNTLEQHLMALGAPIPSRPKVGPRVTGDPDVDEALLQQGGPLRRRILHLVSGPDALTPRELWSLDSIFAAMPGALVRWHVISTCTSTIGEGEANKDPPHQEGGPQQLKGAPNCLVKSRETHFAQIQLFWRAGFDLQYVQHIDLERYMKGNTPMINRFSSSFSLSLCLSLSLSLSLCISLSLAVPLSLSPSVCVSVSLPVYLSLSISLSVSLSLSCMHR